MEGLSGRGLVRAVHLQRKALVYVRQSSSKQVIQNVGSAEYQRSLAGRLRDVGWAESQIEIVDEDLGRSGKTATNRPGYQRIVRDIEDGRIGILALSSIDRGGREAIAWFMLFNLCKDHDVLVCIDGHLHDLRDRNNRVMLKLGAILAENDNEMRTENFMRGRIARAKAGAVVSPMPTGYVRQRDGSLALDPAPGVAEAIKQVFAEFLAQGSIRQTALALRRKSLKVPSRRLGQEVKWFDATTSNVARILRNEIYSGDYHYGRTRQEPALGIMPCGATRWRKTEIDERIVIRDHHEALVSREDAERVRQLLARNAARKKESWRSTKDTLLQGLVWCPKHHRRLTPHHGIKRRDGIRQHFYVCPGDKHGCGGYCMLVRGRAMDALIREAFLERLRPVRLEVLRDAVSRISAEADRERYRRETEENRLRQRVADLKYRYDRIDPDNRLVAAEYGRELEDALKDLRRARDESARADIAQPDHAAIVEEAAALVADLPRLFDAPTTTARERKELLGIMISRVVVLHSSRDATIVEAEWSDGSAPTRLEVPLLGYCERVAAELHDQGLSYADVAAEMNQRGLRTSHDSLWRKHAVKQAIERFRGGSRREVAETPVDPRAALAGEL